MNLTEVQNRVAGYDAQIDGINKQKEETEKLVALYEQVDQLEKAGDVLLPLALVAEKIGNKSLEATLESKLFYNDVVSAFEELGVKVKGYPCAKELHVIWDVLHLVAYNPKREPHGTVDKALLLRYADRGTYVPAIMASEEEVARAKIAMCKAFDKAVERNPEAVIQKKPKPEALAYTAG